MSSGMFRISLLTTQASFIRSVSFSSLADKAGDAEMHSVRKHAANFFMFIGIGSSERSGVVPEETWFFFHSRLPALTCGANEWPFGLAQGRLCFATHCAGR